MTNKVCEHCREFFKRYQCAKTTIGECDCPKCQGYCECYLLDSEPTLKAKSLLFAAGLALAGLAVPAHAGDYYGHVGGWVGYPAYGYGWAPFYRYYYLPPPVVYYQLYRPRYGCGWGWGSGADPSECGRD